MYYGNAIPTILYKNKPIDRSIKICSEKGTTESKKILIKSNFIKKIKYCFGLYRFAPIHYFKSGNYKIFFRIRCNGTYINSDTCGFYVR